MKVFIVVILSIVALCQCSVERRDLIDTLKQLHVSNFLNDLSLDQQLLLVDMIEHGDQGTLTQFLSVVGYDRVLEIMHQLNSTDEMVINTYLINHLKAEAAGPINAHHGVATASHPGK